MFLGYNLFVIFTVTHVIYSLTIKFFYIWAVKDILLTRN